MGIIATTYGWIYLEPLGFFYVDGLISRNEEVNDSQELADWFGSDGRLRTSNNRIAVGRIAHCVRTDRGKYHCRWCKTRLRVNANGMKYWRTKQETQSIREQRQIKAAGEPIATKQPLTGLMRPPGDASARLPPLRLIILQATGRWTDETTS